MKKYVLGENAARKLRKLFNGKMIAGRVDGTTGGVLDDEEFLPPFTVQWAASLSSGDGDSASEGEWIIWLPGDAHVVIATSSVDLSEDLDDAGGEYPSGWFKLGDLLDRDEGGTLYLNVDIENQTAELSDTASNGVSVKVADALVGDDGSRAVKGYVRSVVVLDGGTGGGGGIAYYADEWSVSQMDAQSTRRNFFSLKGFGRYASSVAQGVTLGSFQPSTELSLDEDEASSVAFLVRSGNGDTVDLNQLGYRTLKVKSPSVSSPFRYDKTSSKLVDCRFYWQGQLQTLADYDVSGIVAAGSVFLIGTQTAPSAQAPDPSWTWALGTAAGVAPSGGKALNYKLYDFAQGKPSVDYRTTFLALEDHTQKAKVIVSKPNAASKVEIDASGSKPKIVVSDGDGHSVSIDLADLPSGCGGVFGLHSLSYKDASDQTQTYHGLFCGDIDLTGIKASQISVDAITGLSFAVANGKLQATITKTNTATGAVSTNTVDLLTLVTASVVKSSEYTGGKLVNTLTNLGVLAETTPSPSTADVFETTPHSLEA